MYDEQPFGMSSEAYARQERRRYRIKRVSTVLAYGLLGGVAGLCLSLLLKLQ